MPQCTSDNEQPGGLLNDTIMIGRPIVQLNVNGGGLV